MNLRILLVCVLFFAGLGLAAQTTVTLGTYGSGNQFPFNTSGYSPSSMRYQTCYTASEINLGSGATLTEIRVPMTANPSTMPTWSNFRLRVAHSTTAPTALTTTGTPSCLWGLFMDLVGGRVSHADCAA